MTDEYWEVYKAVAADDLENGAYDETGEQVYCDCCGEEFRWDSEMRKWRCVSCGNVKSRAEYFCYLGANPPGPVCLNQCMENYPRCKVGCPIYDCDPD